MVSIGNEEDYGVRIREVSITVMIVLTDILLSINLWGVGL